MMQYLRIFLCLSLFIITTSSHAQNFGGQSMVAPLKRVLVRTPDASFGNADPELWHYTARPDLDKAKKEHNDFIQILKDEGVDIVFHTTGLPRHADAIFVHDPAILTDKGAIILNMGKPLRQGEEAAIEKTFQQLDIPVLGRLSQAATAEGGDILWLDASTLAIGRGFRTNQQGIDEIRHIVKPLGVNVVQVDLPYDQGKDACLHLQSLISFVDNKKAAVFSKLLPVSFMELLHAKGIELIEVPENEYGTMGTNILAIKPGVCLTIDGNVETKKRLEKAGCKVYTYVGDEISHKAEGGATCLTRPILREM